jgi:RimJ/RimL family protein N-acetyltransferase
MAHWAKIMNDKTLAIQTVIFDGKVAGNIGCWKESDERRVGYWIGKEYWGKGIASAALSEFLKRVTDRPLVAHVAKHNVASIRVLQKCGFTMAGEDKCTSTDGACGEEYVLTLGPPN